MQRHTTGSYVSTTKNIALTVRSVNTIGNYDYQFDYTFYMDGTIETLVRASGYIQSAYFANNTDYGYHINDAVGPDTHDASVLWLTRSCRARCTTTSSRSRRTWTLRERTTRCPSTRSCPRRRSTRGATRPATP